MNNSIRYLVILVISIFDFSTVYSAPTNPAALDQERIHAWYYTGKVDSAARAMERFQQRSPIHSRSDSLFLSKYLGVIYSMNPIDREKGKAMLAGLLALDASATIEDMFAPPEVDSVFNALKPKAKPVAKTAESIQTGEQEKQNQAPAIGADSYRKRMFWIASGLAAATAVGVATYYLVSAEPEPDPPTTAVWDATNPKP
jgi:hypothetical protein